MLVNIEILKFLKQTRGIHFNLENTFSVNIKWILSDMKTDVNSVTGFLNL